MTDMILPQSEDAIHKAWMYRILSALYEDAKLAKVLYFKGGTCAAMLGYLDRFSVDLDFDYAGERREIAKTQESMEVVFNKLGLEIKDKSAVTPQYFLKYHSQDGKRNTLKIDTTFPPPKANTYEPKRFTQIDRIITCQTRETMVANKLVALMDRYIKHGSIAGRDLYDIHHFLMNGYSYNIDVIEERSGKKPADFLAELFSFIEKNVTGTIIDQDLNILLPYPKFSSIRKTLKRETTMFLKDEIARLKI